MPVPPREPPPASGRPTPAVEFARDWQARLASLKWDRLPPMVITQPEGYRRLKWVVMRVILGANLEDQSIQRVQDADEVPAETRLMTEHLRCFPTWRWDPEGPMSAHALAYLDRGMAALLKWLIPREPMVAKLWSLRPFCEPKEGHEEQWGRLVSQVSGDRAHRFADGWQCLGADRAMEEIAAHLGLNSKGSQTPISNFTYSILLASLPRVRLLLPHAEEALRFTWRGKDRKNVMGLIGDAFEGTFPWLFHLGLSELAAAWVYGCGVAREREIHFGGGGGYGPKWNQAPGASLDTFKRAFLQKEMPSRWTGLAKDGKGYMGVWGSPTQVAEVRGSKPEGLETWEESYDLSVDGLDPTGFNQSRRIWDIITFVNGWRACKGVPTNEILRAGRKMSGLMDEPTVASGTPPWIPIQVNKAHVRTLENASSDSDYHTAGEAVGALSIPGSGKVRPGCEYGKCLPIEPCIRNAMTEGTRRSVEGGWRGKRPQGSVCLGCLGHWKGDAVRLQDRGSHSAG